MKIEVAEHERMSETGSSLIRLIQNNDMPILDLLVREAVQNSLDAALPGGGHVQVDFAIRPFLKQELATHFEGIQEQLAKYYPKEQYELLEIRDSNTHGLTGPLHDGECDPAQFGNLIKLIYQVGMPQQREGSGGSWGLGKTVYFRIGIGIVVYYSRIMDKESGTFVSRLAACLVEDESKSDSLLQNKGRHRGIAWWGHEAPGNTGSTMPITNESEIRSILSCLGSRPYTGEETGTCILIPFLRNDLRPAVEQGALEDGLEIHSVQENLWWTHKDTDYITVALQRWYAARLMNPDYPHGRWLRATVDGHGISKERFLPVFRTIQELYNVAVDFGATGDKRSNEVDSESKYKCMPIQLRNTFTSGLTAGWVAYTKLSRVELRMDPPHNEPSPWVQVIGRDLKGESNPALISYTRKPGMIVGFEYTGKWADGIPKSSQDEYIIGLFVANSFNPLSERHPKQPDRDYILEEYIRGCEKADHTSWSDWTPGKKNPLIIDRIQKHLVKHITSSYTEKPVQHTIKRDAVLGKMLADVLLPPEGFGNIPAPKFPAGHGKPTTASHGKNARFIQLSAPIYEGDRLRIDFELFSGKQVPKFEISLKITSESGDIDANVWEGEQGVGVKFPVIIERLEISQIEVSKTSRIDTIGMIQLDKDRPAVNYESIGLELINSVKYRQLCSVHISNAANKTLKGSFWLSSSDRNVRPAFYVDTLTGGSPK